MVAKHSGTPPPAANRRAAARRLGRAVFLLPPAVWLGLRHGLPAGAAWIAGVPHAAIHGALLVWFARSLRPGGVDVITALARRIQPGFHAGMARHTRRVTWLWCGFFAAEIVGSVVLYRFAPPRWWLLFVTGLNLPLAAAVFAAEYAVRRWLFPGHQGVSLRDTVRAFRTQRAGDAEG